MSTNVLAALTGSASGGLTSALEALGATYMAPAADLGVDPAFNHPHIESERDPRSP